VVLQTQIALRLPTAGPGVLGETGVAIPLDVVNKLAQAFATSFWWSFGTCVIAIIPALFLPAAPSLAPALPMDEVSELDV